MQPAIFLDRDGVITLEKSFITKPSELEYYSDTFEAVRLINQSGYLVVVVSNQSAVARNYCSIDDINLIHEKMQKDFEKQGVHFDKIYFCPHLFSPSNHTINPLYNIDCDCRKPKTGMFHQAAKELQIDLSRSFMIGDSERDIIAGKNAGCKTIGLMRGYALKNANEIPDFIFNDLLNAVKFILNSIDN